MISIIIADWNLLDGVTWWVPSSPSQENEPLENRAECCQLKRIPFVLFYPAPYTRPQINDIYLWLDVPLVDIPLTKNVEIFSSPLLSNARPAATVYKIRSVV